MLPKRSVIYTIISLITLSISQGQSNTVSMNESKNNISPLLCDPEEGMCQMPQIQDRNEISDVIDVQTKKVKIVYFTDPICSSCWGIEPQLRKLKLAYGDHIDLEYRMGGLLPDWSYNSGGISKPSDVARHWDEASIHYDMPMDGDVWLEDPLDSSYPPSIAYIAAKMQSHHKADVFLREIREMVFFWKKNITKWVHLEEAATIAGLDIEQFKNDFNGKARKLFEEDLKLAQEYGVRGFPTMFFIDSLGNKETVNGSKPYEFYENAILKVQPKALKNDYKKDWRSIFKKFQTLTVREFSEISETPKAECENLLNQLGEDGKLDKLSSKNGAVWSVIDTSR